MLKIYENSDFIRITTLGLILGLNVNFLFSFCWWRRRDFGDDLFAALDNCYLLNNV